MSTTINVTVGGQGLVKQSRQQSQANRLGKLERDQDAKVLADATQKKVEQVQKDDPTGRRPVAKRMMDEPAANRQQDGFILLPHRDFLPLDKGTYYEQIAWVPKGPLSSYNPYASDPASLNQRPYISGTYRDEEDDNGYFVAKTSFAAGQGPNGLNAISLYIGAVAFFSPAIELRMQFNRDGTWPERVISQVDKALYAYPEKNEASTVEFWFKLTSVTKRFFMTIDFSAFSLDTSANGGLDTIAPSALANWTHVAASGRGANWRIYIGGSQVWSTDTANGAVSFGHILLGSQPIDADGEDHSVQAYVSAIRVTKGKELYSGTTITPRQPRP